MNEAHSEHAQLLPCGLNCLIQHYYIIIWTLFGEGGGGVVMAHFVSHNTEHNHSNLYQ